MRFTASYVSANPCTVAQKLNRQVERIAILEQEIASTHELVVWGFYEERVPSYHQGAKGAHELTSPITAVEANNLVAKLEASIPRLEGATHSATKDGQWFYLNHAQTWQTMPAFMPVQDHDARVTELLEANNVEVERRREAERLLESTRRSMDIQVEVSVKQQFRIADLIAQIGTYKTVWLKGILAELSDGR